MSLTATALNAAGLAIFVKDSSGWTFHNSPEDVTSMLVLEVLISVPLSAPLTESNTS